MAQVNDLDAARRSRERDKSESNIFYAQQAHAVAQWTWGELPPESVILGGLPYCGKVGRGQARFDRD